MRPHTILAIDDSPTILRVVQLVLTRAGYDVQTAADGEEGLRLAHELRPDLLLLDFVMPRMNGYQVCRALAESAVTSAIPVVLMSAKGDQVGERFVKVMGIVDYITKPFSPEALSEVVARTLARAPRESTGADFELPDELPSDLVTNPGGAIPHLVEASDTTRFQKAGASPSPATARDLSKESAAAVAAVASAMPAEAERAGEHDDEVILAGDLARVPLPEVLSLCAEQRQTGVLSVRQGTRRVDVSLRAGRIEFADAEGLGEDLLLGRFLVEREAISRHDLDLFFRSRGSSTRLCGEQLVKLNYVSPQDLQNALARQTAERVFEAMRFRNGRFSLRALADLSPRANQAALHIGVDELLLEGYRRIEDWHLVEREVDDPELVYLRNEEALARLGRDQLGRDELAVLELVNAKNSVRDIVRQSRLGGFEVSKMLARLSTVRLIRRRVQPVAV